MYQECKNHYLFFVNASTSLRSITCVECSVMVRRNRYTLSLPLMSCLWEGGAGPSRLPSHPHGPKCIPSFHMFPKPRFHSLHPCGKFRTRGNVHTTSGARCRRDERRLEPHLGAPEDQVALSSRWRLINCRRGRAEASRIQASSTTRINEVQMRPTGQICRRGADKRAGLARIVTLHVGGEGETRGQTAWVDARAVDEEVRIVCAGRE